MMFVGITSFPINEFKSYLDNKGMNSFKGFHICHLYCKANHKLAYNNDIDLFQRLVRNFHTYLLPCIAIMQSTVQGTTFKHQQTEMKSTPLTACDQYFHLFLPHEAPASRIFRSIEDFFLDAHVHSGKMHQLLLKFKPSAIVVLQTRRHTFVRGFRLLCVGRHFRHLATDLK